MVPHGYDEASPVVRSPPSYGMRNVITLGSSLERTLSMTSRMTWNAHRRHASFRAWARTLALVVSFAPIAMATETYIVPIWTGAHHGADATWISRVAISNPNNYAVTISILDVLPLATEPCPLCHHSPQVAIPPHGRALVRPGLPDEFVRATAFSFTATGPVLVDHRMYAYGFQLGGRQSITEIPTARRWIQAGDAVLIHGLLNTVEFQCNLFVANAEFVATEVVYEYATSGGVRKYALSVPPRNTVFAYLPAPDCEGQVCIPTLQLPPPTATLHLRSTGAVAALGSCFSPEDAVTSLPIVLAE
jgi:hypothetical protein